MTTVNVVFAVTVWLIVLLDTPPPYPILVPLAIGPLVLPPPPPPTTKILTTVTLLSK